MNSELEYQQAITRLLNEIFKLEDEIERLKKQGGDNKNEKSNIIRWDPWFNGQFGDVPNASWK
jgi:hypothetical protein